MSGAKRMSAEEKRKVILGIYHKELQVYTEKEIFALISKAGVSASSIENVHQELVDNGDIEKKKIGGSNYFWSFPAKKERKAQIEHEKTVGQIAELKVKIEEAAAQLADAKRGREDQGEGEDSRASKLSRLADLDKEKSKIEAELEVLKENDPAALADLEKELQLVRNGAERWTDNIFACKDHLVKKRGFEKKTALKILGITDAFDYVED